MPLGVKLAVDCADPVRLAAFWAAALEYRPHDPPPGYPDWDAFWDAAGAPAGERGVAIVDPAGVRPRIWFQKVPEPKVVKNRMHLDLDASGGRGVPDGVRRQRVADTVARLVAAGATVQRETTETGGTFVVMQDPEGNEFCVL